VNIHFNRLTLKEETAMLTTRPLGTRNNTTGEFTAFPPDQNEQRFTTVTTTVVDNSDRYRFLGYLAGFAALVAVVWIAAASVIDVRTYKTCDDVVLCTADVTADIEIKQGIAKSKIELAKKRLEMQATRDEQRAALRAAEIERPRTIHRPTAGGTNVVTSPVRCGGNPCGGATVVGQGIATKLPDGRCTAPAGSPHAGQQGWLWSNGTCHKYPERQASMR